MAMSSPLDSWKFLIGEWKGETKAEDQFGEKEKIEGTATFALDPSERFIMSQGEARSGDKLLNKSISIMFYDDAEEKLKRKTFFSYGFVNNEVEISRAENEIIFDVTMEPKRKQFAGTQWRSFIRKISNDRIAVGLEVRKRGKSFMPYGEEIFIRKTSINALLESLNKPR
jgi:hypothetical protein